MGTLKWMDTRLCLKDLFISFTCLHRRWSMTSDILSIFFLLLHSSLFFFFSTANISRARDSPPCVHEKWRNEIKDESYFRKSPIMKSWRRNKSIFIVAWTCNRLSIRLSDRFHLIDVMSLRTLPHLIIWSSASTHTDRRITRAHHHHHRHTSIHRAGSMSSN